MFLRRPSDFFAFLFIFYLFLWILYISENNLRYVIPCNTIDVIYVIKTIPFYNAGVILPLKFQSEIRSENEGGLKFQFLVFSASSEIPCFKYLWISPHLCFFIYAMFLL